MSRRIVGRRTMSFWIGPAFGLLLLLSCGVVWAQDAETGAESGWSVSVGGTVVRGLEEQPAVTDAGSGTDAIGAVVAVEHYRGPWSVGIAVGTSDRDEGLPDSVVLEEDLSLSLSGWVVRSFGPVALTLSADYGMDRFEGPIEDTGLASDPVLEGETNFFGFAAGLSRTFGIRTRLVPSATVSWGRSTSTTRVTTDIALLSDLEEEVTSEGFSGSLGIALGHDVTDWFTVFISGSGNAAENEAATQRNSTIFGRNSAGPVSSESFDPVQWAEVGGGVVLSHGRTSLSLDAVATFGQEADFVSTGLTITRSF